MLTMYRRVDELFSLVTLFFLFASVSISNANIIKTRLGALEGLKKEARNGKFFHAYYGIPYARPPVGRLRFEPPVEAKAWSGVFNATKIPPECPQILEGSALFAGKEDCLFVHVYTPSDAKAGTNLPVLFYIFGGGFMEAKPTDFGPEFIMSRDVILVMVSYRLGVLGFLSTGDDVIPGNMALRDQTLAMKWTRENIYQFGGDPHKITIQGHSSGAGCVHAHTMSPLSKDYFDQVIMQSGFVAANGIWDPEYASTIAREFGRQVNCPMQSSKLLKRCLQSRTAEELVTASVKQHVGSRYALSRFRPVIEDDRVVNAFLNESSYFGTHSNFSKHMLFGITSGESALNIAETRVISDEGLRPGLFSIISGFFNPDSSSINVDPKLLFPEIGAFEWSSKLNQLDFIAQLLKTRFFGEEEVRNTTDIADIALMKIMNGLRFGRHIIDIVQRYGGRKYVYLMDYRYAGGYTHATEGGRGGRYLGVSHSEELPIIWNMNKTGIADEDFAFGEEIITRFVNFAYSGDPNLPFAINTSVFGPWASVSSSQIEFLRINRHGGMENDYFLEEYGLFRKIPMFSKYYVE